MALALQDALETAFAAEFLGYDEDAGGFLTVGADRAPDPCLREIKTGMIGKRTAVGRKHALGDADDQYPGEPAAQVDGQTKPRPAVPGGVRED